MGEDADTHGIYADEIDAPESVIATMEDEIKAVVARLRELIAEAGASRPLAVAHEKAEEAVMWVEKHFASADAAG